MFDIAHQIGHGYVGFKPEKDMNMIRHAVDRK